MENDEQQILQEVTDAEKPPSDAESTAEQSAPTAEEQSKTARKKKKQKAKKKHKNAWLTWGISRIFLIVCADCNFQLFNRNFG